MRVAEIMRTNVQSIGADDSILDAVTVMADAHVSGLPVVDSTRQVIGVISATDILQAEAEQPDARARGQLFTNTTVRELMTRKAHTVSPDDEVRDAARTMLYAEVGRLFVVDKGMLVGVISRTDIAHAVAKGKL